MTFISSNTRFYIATAETFFLLFVFIFICDYLAISESPPFQDYPYLVAIYYCIMLVLNYLFFYFFYVLHKCYKIHRLKKIYKYSALLELLKEQKTKYDFIQCNNDGLQPSHEQKLLGKYLISYMQLRNSHTQKDLNSFIIVLLLFVFANSINVFATVILLVFAVGLLFWGLAKVARGYIEIV